MKHVINCNCNVKLYKTSEFSRAFVVSLSQSFVRVTVMNSYPVEIISIVIGWIYFLAWSVSFYPQIVENIRRKRYISLSELPLAHFQFLIT